MKRGVLLVAALAALVSSSAFADNCEASIKKIDAAMGGDLDPALSGAQIEQVMKLRAEAQALHEAGKHDQALALLKQVRKTMGI
ncbi:MAG: hypothetical protein KDH20_08725 [Rhodocyclaceae bacterium]|nr:hypothetical protein [Rhodocyclaceae bacterium]